MKSPSTKKKRRRISTNSLPPFDDGYQPDSSAGEPVFWPSAGIQKFPEGELIRFLPAERTSASRERGSCAGVEPASFMVDGFRLDFGPKIASLPATSPATSSHTPEPAKTILIYSNERLSVPLSPFSSRHLEKEFPISILAESSSLLSAEQWRERAKAFVSEFRFQEAREACTEMLRLWGETRGPEFFEALITTIAANARCGEFGVALGYLEEAARRASTPAQRFITRKFEGNCHLVMGDFERAMESFHHAWQLAIELDDVPKQAAVLNNIGIIQRELGDFATALEYFQRGFALAGTDVIGIRIARYNIGGTLLDLKRCDEAEAELVLVYEDSREHNDVLHQGLALYTFGEIAEMRGDPVKALDYFNQAEPLLSASGDSRAKLQIDISRAEKLAKNSATPDQAIHRIERAVADAEPVGGRLLILALRTQVEIFTQAGRTEQALQSSRRQAQLETEYHQHESRGRLESLRVLHEMETLKHEAEIAHLKNEDLARALAEADLQRERAERGHAFTKGVLAMAAHDLRNPVGSVQGILELLSGEEDPDERAELTRLALDQTQVTLDLLDRLLDSVLVQRGEMRLRLEPLDLVVLTSSTLRAHSSAATRKGQSLVFDATPPSVRVNGDAVRLRQVLENLLSNAIKYSPTGAKLTVQVSRQDEPEPLAVIRVIDQGPGIPADARERIFEPFNRIPGIKPTGGEDSIGLGLHLARELTRAHQGTLTVEPVAATGSSFVLHLPLLPVDQAPGANLGSDRRNR